MALTDSPQPAEFRYTLLIRGVETWVLPNAPKGWEGSLINQSRNVEFWGMFRKFTTKMDFVLDAAHLLRREFYTYGIAAQVQLKIEKLNQSLWQYQQIYLGDIDFSTFKDTGSADGYIVTASIMDAGIAAMVNTYKDVKYSIPLNVPEAITLTLNGITLAETASYSFAFQGTRHDYYFPGLNLNQNQQNSVNQSSFQVGYDQFQNPDFSTRQSYFFQAQCDGQIKITNTDPKLQLGNAGQIAGILYIGLGGSHVSMGIYNQNGTLLHTIVSDDTLGVSGISGPHAYSVNINLILNVSRSDKLFIYINGTTPSESIDVTNGTLFTRYNTISPPTTVLAHRASYVFTYLMQQIYKNLPPNDNVPTPLETQSFLLQQWHQLVITCGDAIRPGFTPQYIYPGYNLTIGKMYTVKGGTVVYHGITYITGQSFNTVSGVITFTTPDNGYLLQSPDTILFYPGDDLNPGSTYQIVQDTIGYNGKTYGLGQTFIAVTGVNTFTSESFGQVIELSDPLLIKTSFAEFFKSINAVLCAGFGVEGNTAVLESKDYWMKGTLPCLNVGNVKKFELDVYTDLMGSSITIGYPDQTYDIVNGLDEYNSQQVYQLPITRVQKPIDLMSQYRADMYGIEFLRIQANSVSATKGDSEVFFIKTQPNPTTDPISGQQTYYTEGAEAFTSVSGTRAGIYAYNIGLSPKENLYRHGAYLHSILNVYNGYSILFTSALKSTLLSVVTTSGKIISESSNADISGLDAAFFMPYAVTITTKLPLETLAAIDGSNTGFITFSQDGINYTGYIMDISVDVAKNTEQTFKLLLCASNNLNSLIH